MMGTTADKLEYLQGTKAAIKQAIVNKGVAVPDGTTFRGYAEKIGDIIDAPDLSNPGAAGDLRSGKQLVGADGSIVTGNLPEVIQATPTISVSSSGLITASATQSGGIVAAGFKGDTLQLPVQKVKTVMPTTTEQVAIAPQRWAVDGVFVAGDANLVPENIAEGVSIFGVTGTFAGGGGDISYSEVDRETWWNYHDYSNAVDIIAMQYDGTNTSLGGNARTYYLTVTHNFDRGGYCETQSNFRYAVSWPSYTSLKVVINDYDVDIGQLRSSVSSESLIPGFSFKYYLRNN